MVRRVFVCALCAPLLLAACAAPPRDLEAPTETEVAANLRTAFDYLYDNYYEEIRLENVVLPGLENLRSLEPDLGVALVTTPETGSFVEVRLRDELIYRVRNPAWYAGDGWSAVVRNTIKALRVASPKVANISWVETTDLVLAGAAKTLDGNSVYLSHGELKAVGFVADDDENAGTDDGAEADEDRASAGIRLRDEEGVTRIAQIRRNSAAAQAGLRAGDVVEAVEGQPAGSFSRLQIGTQFVGAPDSAMTLAVRRPGAAQTEQVVLRRETVNFATPVALWRDRILYLQLTSLWGDTVDGIELLLRGEGAKGSEGASGIVLDLRGTHVANAFAAARLLDLFNDGDRRYFRTQAKDYPARYVFRPRETPENVEIPIVVLVNGETSGAAEAIAAAFQHHSRAVVLGNITAGQGRLQAGAFLLNGGLFAFTGSVLFTPDGYAIDKRGVLPTICMRGDVTADAALAALRSGGGVIDRATRTRDVDPDDAAAVAAFRALCPPRSDRADVSLEVARALLADALLYAAVLAASDDQKSAAR